MTAREYIAPLAARLRTALADEKQRVNLLVLMGLAGLVLLAFSVWLPADDAAQPAPAAVQETAADYAAQLESRLTALIRVWTAQAIPPSWLRWNQAVRASMQRTRTAMAAPPMCFWAAAAQTDLWRPYRHPVCWA